MKPVNTEAIEPGTRRVPACSGNSGSIRASATAAIVPPAPNSSDGTKPMNGSISRSICAARMARRNKPGITTPLPTIVASTTSTTCQSSVSRSIASGIMPSNIPCTDMARISDGNRLLPSASRFNPIARPIRRFNVPLIWHRLSTPPAAQTDTAETRL